MKIFCALELGRKWIGICKPNMFGFSYPRPLEVYGELPVFFKMLYPLLQATLQFLKLGRKLICALPLLRVVECHCLSISKKLYISRSSILS